VNVDVDVERGSRFRGAGTQRLLIALGDGGGRNSLTSRRRRGTGRRHARKRQQ
jgi:hypothetical protein